MRFLNANNATTVIAAGIGAGDVSVTLATGAGALFPSPVPGTSYFVGTLGSNTPNEIVQVTNRVGDVLTIVRAYEGTSAAAWPLGAKFQQLVTAGQIQALQQTFFEATKTTSYGINPITDNVIICTNAITITLPTAVGINGQPFVIKNGNAIGSGLNITMATTSAQTIDGTAPGTITPLASQTFVSDGANWWII